MNFKAKSKQTAWGEMPRNTARRSSGKANSQTLCVPQCVAQSKQRGKANLGEAYSLSLSLSRLWAKFS